MPELPEVETVRRGLNRLIKGKTIKDVNVLYDKIIVGSKAEFCKKLSGKKLLDVDRRGKYLLFRFSGDLTMVSHLRMEGKYFVRQKGEPVEKHTHVIFYLMDGSELHYNDVRKFGRMELFKTGEETTLSGISKLGPEPTEKNFDSQKFYEGLQKKKKPIISSHSISIQMKILLVLDMFLIFVKTIKQVNRSQNIYVKTYLV